MYFTIEENWRELQVLELIFILHYKHSHAPTINVWGRVTRVA